MAIHIRTLTDYNDNTIYPHSTAEAIQRQDASKTVEASFVELENLAHSKASLADVNTAVDTLLGSGAAASLQTLQSLSQALGDDTNFAQNMLAALNAKQDLLTQQQCGTSLLTVNGISDNDNSIPTAAMVKTYVDTGLNGKIGMITIDGTNYYGTSVTLNLGQYIKSTDAGSAADPLPVNAQTLNGYDYNDLIADLSCVSDESNDNANYPIVCWDEDEEDEGNSKYKYSALISMNPSTGNITANKVYNAVYNDYAEWFEKDDYNDNSFEPGDVCVWTGNGVIKSSKKNDTAVIGVVSDSYGHILGGEKISNMEKNNKKFVPIGLTGRVKVKVRGEVEIGDLLVSGPNGCAIVNNDAKPNMIIGKALENSYDSFQRKIWILI